MTAREEVVEILREAPEGVVNKVLELLRLLTGGRRPESLETAVASEPTLGRDWNASEEDEAWRDL